MRALVREHGSQLLFRRHHAQQAGVDDDFAAGGDHGVDGGLTKERRGGSAAAQPVPPLSLSPPLCFSSSYLIHDDELPLQPLHVVHVPPSGAIRRGGRQPAPDALDRARRGVRRE